MENSEEGLKRKAVKLPWKPAYNPAARAAFQVGLGESLSDDWITKDQASMDFWYIEMWRIAEVVKPHVDAFHADPEKMAGMIDDPYHEAELESIYLLRDKESDFPDVIPDPWSAAIEQVVDGEDCVFFPYEFLEKGGHLLHTREEYLRVFMEFALAAQTANPRVDAPPVLTTEHGPTLPEV